MYAQYCLLTLRCIHVSCVCTYTYVCALTCHLQDDDDVTILTAAVSATASTALDSCAQTADTADATGRHRKDDVVIRLTREALQLASAWCHVSMTHADVAASFPFVVHELLCALNDPAVQAQLSK
jgi:hypothetical protein